MSDAPTVTIEYRRLPDRSETFEQSLIARDDDAVVTLLDAARIDAPMHVGAAIVLEPGAPIVWFTWPDRWHDIGRFHRRDGTFTGWYANVLRPVEGLRGDRWRTTDLCLDVWLPVDGEPVVLDEDEFSAAVDAGWIDAATADRARAEVAALMRGAEAGRWPPRVAQEWTLERVRETRPPRAV